jgi:hypothetical protein
MYECRRGLARFLNFVVNHPVIRDDGFLAVFLTEPSLDQWRKNSSVSLEEESTGKRIDRVEEMAIPSDLEDKLQCDVSSFRLRCPQLFTRPFSQSGSFQVGPADRTVAEDLHLG